MLHATKFDHLKADGSEYSPSFIELSNCESLVAGQCVKTNY